MDYEDPYDYRKSMPKREKSRKKRLHRYQLLMNKKKEYDQNNEQCQGQG